MILHFKKTLWLVVLTTILSSCTIFHRIKEDEVYLKKDAIIYHDAPNEFAVSKSTLKELTKLKPNRRVALMRINLGIYTLVPNKALKRSEIRAAERCIKKNNRRKGKGKQPKECKSLWMWLAYTVGEPPAQLDSNKMEKSAQQMGNYLEKRGYFNNRVETEVIFKKKGLIFWRKGLKCKLNYHIYPNEPYRIKDVKYEFDDTQMLKRKDELFESSIIKKGEIFDVDVLDKERERIATFFNNKGYFEFTKDFISYDVDTTLGGRNAYVTLRLRQIQAPSANKDSTLYFNHKKYFIGDVLVYTNSDPLNPDEVFKDTLYHQGLTIIYNDQPDLKENLLAYTTLFLPNEMFQKDKVDLTYKRFSQLGTNRAVNIQMLPRAATDSNGVYILDAAIRLNPAKKQVFNVNPSLLNRAGNTGIYSNMLWSHKNVFRGAERLEFRIVTGFEATRAITEETSQETSGEEVRRAFQLNTFEFGPEVSLRVPRILGTPFLRFKKNSEPFTNFSFAVNYQRRPDYERTLTLLRTQWGFTENKDKGTKFFPHWDLSIISIQKSAEFEAFLLRLNDSFLANSYQNHLVHSFGVDFVQNTQKAKYQRFYFFHKVGVELAGKVIPPLLAQVFSAPQDEQGRYYFNGIQYADYVKVDGDSRFYINVNERNTVVFRAAGGLGIAGRNLNVLPFEESFFSGGANGIRAWQARTLGPGSFRDTTVVRSFNNIGDVQLEFNVEYRFKVTQMFQGAFFVDAGNIWMYRAEENRPGADFSTDRFLSEIAIGSGFGLRLDFEFFLVRFDLGLQIKDPLKIEGERWFWEPKDEFNQFLADVSDSPIAPRYRMNRVFNLGIGFPF
jgi:hypothetical protein